MPRFRYATLLVIAIVIAAVAPSTAGAAEATSQNPTSTSAVDFGDCTELATGTVVALSELQERVPDEVPVLSLTDQGAVFPGSDDLGVVITRVLECDSISVTRDGKTRTQV
ncbi:MAG: hypothetical protein HKN07_15120, partial [Acidimicrobiia bacterium]|nr:hypothetical protein [Acidimicrobiia bacterium]